MENFDVLCENISKADYVKNFSELNIFEMHNCIAKAVRCLNFENIIKSKEKHKKARRAFYFSAEFLVGRAIYNNLISLGVYDETKEFLSSKNVGMDVFENIEDAALGNGGLGRLAACYLESAATTNLPLDGYGIRYRYGLFKQKISDGFQKEFADNWTQFGDSWSVRKEDESVIVNFSGTKVKAVPYDMPVFGYKTEHISNIRLWQCEPLCDFDFEKFNEGMFAEAYKERVDAETVTSVLYPNDNTEQGKILRLKQQYFFSSASLQDIIRTYKNTFGNSYDKFSDYIVIQLNDTHPVISIPELIRLMTEDGLDFETALNISRKVFRYTNHTVMSEALEKWNMDTVKIISPEICDIILKINNSFEKEKSVEKSDDNCRIIENGKVNMAHLAAYVSMYINGVAEIHTDILKTDVLKEINSLYPDKIKNVTNGVTQRRWLLVCNKDLALLITKLLKSDEWIKELAMLEKLKKFADNKEILEKFMDIKKNNKKVLSQYTEKKDGFKFDSDFMVDVQIKRLHEYKRQLLNILTILEIYYEIKEGRLVDFYPTVFIFAAKAAPGYERAKAVIKLINEVSTLIENDSDVSKKIRVKFLSDYNVSYAEKIIAAADVSEQISTAGTEASGTGNMKLMLNGAVTLGTYDGANIEIVKEAGTENNYIFGADVKEIDNIKDLYDPKTIYESNSSVKRCLDALIDGSLDDGGTGAFRELYNSLLEGAEWHRADNYFLLYDFDSYLKAKLKVNDDYKDRISFAKKSFLNVCNSGKFSSDRSVREYARNIWQIEEAE